ncbi:MAG: cbb3-type cytochrome c oxidase subunit I [Proteobacteria bacterium]|nr:cbb3-type cytochrome c oxidase subunit I [Pseudomonadota bacterium]
MPRVTRLLLLFSVAMILLLGPVVYTAWSWSQPGFFGVSRLKAGILAASSLLGFGVFVAATSRSDVRRRWFTFPATWLAVAIMSCGATALPISPVADGAAGGAYSVQETYYVVAHGHYVLSLFGAFAVFALAYAVVWGWLHLPRRPRLGWAHLILFTLGVTVIFCPQVVLGWQGMPKRYVDYPAVFKFWNRVSSVGYLITLVALVPFLAVLVLALKDLWARRRAASMKAP